MLIQRLLFFGWFGLGNHEVELAFIILYIPTDLLFTLLQLILFGPKLWGKLTFDVSLTTNINDFKSFSIAFNVCDGILVYCCYGRHIWSSLLLNNIVCDQDLDDDLKDKVDKTIFNIMINIYQARRSI